MNDVAQPVAQRLVRLPRRAVHGVVLLDKPLGWSSNDALQKVKRLLRAEKAGHTGTLDPMATGLLPLCFGAATKFSQVSLEADKTYQATLKLGVTTTTGDREGDVLETRPVSSVTADAVEAARRQLVGPIRQVPPMHSALKKNGRALYDYARQGIEVEREPRDVVVHRLDVLSWVGDELRIETCVSKGTYIRTLAEDLGTLLGCGAHLIALRRTGSGPVRVGDAIGIDAFVAMSEAEREACILPPDVLIADWPRVELSAEEAGRFLSGLRRRVPLADAPAVRVYGPDEGALLGAAHIRAGELIPSRLLSPLEVQGVMRTPALAPTPGTPRLQ